MGGVGQLLAAAPRPAAPTARLQPLPHAGQVEAQPAEGRRAGSIRADECQQDVLGADRVVLQAQRLGPGPVERSLRAGAQGVRIDAGLGLILAQSGFASSTSMMGIPSSTG